MYYKTIGRCFVKYPKDPSMGVNEHAEQKYNDRACKERCESSHYCTGYDIPKTGNNCTVWQYEYGITGDDHPEYACYAKTGNSRYSVNAVFTILGTVNLVNLINLSLQKLQKFLKIKILSL